MLPYGSAEIVCHGYTHKDSLSYSTDCLNT